MSAPGKAFRKGITLLELMRMFPDDETAERWSVQTRWPHGIRCPHCGSERAGAKANHPSQLYHCADCRSFFSAKTNSVMHASKVGYQKWAMAIYLMTTNLKGVSSMKLHRDIGVSQKTAWYMAHRIREGWETDVETFGGPVEADETYIGDKESNKHESKKLKAGRGAVGKTAVAGVKDRPTNQIDAKVVDAVDSATLVNYVHSKTDPNALVYTDEARAYWKLRRPHESVRHSIGKYVKGLAHTNGLESFWATSSADATASITI